MDTSEHPITDLVHHLLDAVQAVVSSDDAPAGSLRPAEFYYELDQVVSDYLDQNQLSAEQFESIQQQVINSIAHQFASDTQPDHPGTPVLDQHGNADLADVLAFLDQHTPADSQVYDYIHHDVVGHDLPADLGLSDPFA